MVSSNARWRNLMLVARKSTIRLPCTLCRPTMTALEKVLSVIFCAVPAFNRVLPAITSGPVAMVMPMSASWATALSGLLAMPMVSAPDARAACNAPST